MEASQKSQGGRSGKPRGVGLRAVELVLCAAGESRSMQVLVIAEGLVIALLSLKTRYTAHILAGR